MVLLKCLPLIVLGLISFGMAMAVLQRGYKKHANVAFSLLSMGVGGWVLGIAAFLMTTDPKAAIVWAKIYYSFPMLIGASMVYFAYLFPDKKSMPRGLFWVTTISFIVLTIPLLFGKDFMITGLVYHDWGKEIILSRPEYAVYSLFLCLTFLEALRIFYKKSKSSTGLYKSQASLLFTGIVISAILGVLFNLALPGFGNYRLIHLGPLATNFFLIAIAYSIIKHRMFDLRLIIVRSSAYVLSLGFMAVLYGVVSYLLSSAAFEAVKGTRLETILNIVLLIVVAVTFSPIKHWFDRVTNKFFYRDAYDPQQFLDQLNRVVVTNVDVQQLLEQSAAVIDDHLKAQYCAFSLRETAYTAQRVIGQLSKPMDTEDLERIRKLTAHIHQRVIVADSLEDEPELLELMRRNDIAILARLVTTLKYDVEGVGYLVLGPKKSGNPYSKQDINIIRIIANELVIAIENALRFEEIENFNVTLQEKVDDATKRLKKANGKLKQMDETKDEFISMASHQLRTPLTSVKGYLSMVLEGDAGELTEMQKKLLDQAFTSSQRMVFLIADLLNLSRLRTGKFVIETNPTNLADVVEGEIQQLQETAAGRNLKLLFEKPKDFPALMLDETKIRQVIMNFVDNAIYYTPAGGTIVIKLKQTAGSVEFTVDDDGIGVPKAVQHHLFNKFYRADNARKARPDGTGLGLFMAKKVVVAQGGAIIFRSTEGKGSTFGFTFSKEKLKVPASPAKPATEAKEPVAAQA